MALAGHCIEEADGIKPLTAQEVLAYCEGLGVELLYQEFQYIVPLSKAFVRAVKEFQNNPTAKDPAED